MTAFPWQPLERALGRAQRESVREQLRSLLRWQRTLRNWPEDIRAPEATPSVSLYESGRLRGCMGSNEGTGRERLARAFVLALGDQRFGGLHPEGRWDLRAQVSYARDVRECDREQVVETMEVGTHGLALVQSDAPAAVLVPQVARDGGLDARGMLDALARKAGRAQGDWRDGVVFMFETDDIVALPDARDEVEDTNPRDDACDLAAAWLARVVGDTDGVIYALDPRTGAVFRGGDAFHARLAVAIQALAAHGGHARALAAGRSRLGSDLERASRGEPVADWPAEPARIAGSMALATRAGAGGEVLVRELRAFSTAHAAEIAVSPWQGAQVVLALGGEADSSIWRACVADLDSRPWAPWTAMAARALGESAVLDRVERALADSVRMNSPHAGGVGVTRVPEIALTAVTIEALEASTDKRSRTAVASAREFLRRWQFRPSSITGAVDSRHAAGAFPASPVVDRLRCDITGHALLALSEKRPTTKPARRTRGR